VDAVVYCQDWEHLKYSCLEVANWNHKYLTTGMVNIIKRSTKKLVTPYSKDPVQSHDVALF
jgi:hypothetical protein